MGADDSVRLNVYVLLSAHCTAAGRVMPSLDQLTFGQFSYYALDFISVPLHEAMETITSTLRTFSSTPHSPVEWPWRVPAGQRHVHQEFHTLFRRTGHAHSHRCPGVLGGTPERRGAPS